MKKCFKIIALLMVVCVIFVGCASTKGSLYGANQREASKLPRWAGEGVSFLSSAAESYGAIVFSEKGVYACGMSENLGSTRATAAAANLGARTAISNMYSHQVKGSVYV